MPLTADALAIFRDSDFKRFTAAEVRASKLVSEILRLHLGGVKLEPFLLPESVRELQRVANLDGPCKPWGPALGTNGSRFAALGTNGSPFAYRWVRVEGG